MSEKFGIRPSDLVDENREILKTNLSRFIFDQRVLTIYLSEQAQQLKSPEKMSVSERIKLERLKWKFG